MGALNKFLRKNPGVIKRVVYGLVPYGARYGRMYGEMLRMLHGSQYWSPEDILAYQRGQLRILVESAYANTEFYRWLFDEHNLTPDDIRTPFDLRKLPITTRETLIKHREGMTDDKLLHKAMKKNRLACIQTSGSSGMIAKFYADKSFYEREAAFIERACRSHGSTLYNGKSIWLRRYVSAYDDRSQTFYLDREQQRLYMTPFNLNRFEIGRIVETMNRYKAPLLVGYPSSIYILALLMEKTALKLTRVKAIQVSSEMLPPEWSTKIERVLGVPVYDHYGQAEHVILLHRCAAGVYHNNPEYGITEIVDGRLIGTSFNNPMTPLIRYDTGDMAVEGTNKTRCTGCGTTLPQTVKRIEGRHDDIIVSARGTMIPPVNFYTMMYGIAGVDMFRIVQYTDNKVTIKILATLKMYDGASRVVRREMERRLGTDMEINVVRVSEPFERDTVTGKIKCVVNMKEAYRAQGS